MEQGKKKNGCLAAILIVVGILVLIGLFSNKDKENTVDKGASDTNASHVSEVADGAEADATEAVTTAKIGDTLNVGDVSYVVVSVETATQVGSEYLNSTANGIYLVVTLSVTNHSSESLTISDTFFKIQSGDKTFDADSTATLYADAENSFWYESLNPDLTMTGIVVFDVSEEVAASMDSNLQVQTGFWGTQTGIISLER